MTASIPELDIPSVADVCTGPRRLCFHLSDGRTVSAPIDWFPRLVHGSVRERRNWKIVGAGFGVHWPDLDEDVSVENMLLGQRSVESERSLRDWLDSRPRRRRSQSGS
jgi:Protein of unknown function (DUF2442)